ncbi:MAG: hypothetical protein AABY22_04620 [Nanoarchaeota archaeon]
MTREELIHWLNSDIIKALKEGKEFEIKCFHSWDNLLKNNYDLLFLEPNRIRIKKNKEQNKVWESVGEIPFTHAFRLKKNLNVFKFIDSVNKLGKTVTFVFGDNFFIYNLKKLSDEFEHSPDLINWYPCDKTWIKLLVEKNIKDE